jgi:uncharacterized protein YjeT (DUF2065 family)
MEGYWGTLLVAFALMLVIELSDGQIRFVGLTSMIAGLLLLLLTN